jgi:hypothetical protein
MGAPGNIGCIAPVWLYWEPFLVAAPRGDNINSGLYCTYPSENIERIDPYDTLKGGGHPIYCNLPTPSCDPAIPNGISTLLFYQQSGNTPQQTTFYFTTDVHPYRGVNWKPENFLEHVRQLNNLPGSPYSPAFRWTWTRDGIAAPSGLVIGGDVGSDAPTLGAFRLIYEQWRDASLQFPFFFGLGNHEIKTNADEAGAHRMFDYLKHRMGSCGGISQDSQTGNYSWDWGRLHLIMLNTWADETTSKYNQNASGHGLDWLRNDLQTRVGGTGRPVVLFQHYSFSSLGDSSWNPANATLFLNVIRDYNIVGIFAGHTHTPSVDRLDKSDWHDSSGGHLLYDSAGHEKVIDIFTNGTGGVGYPESDTLPPTLGMGDVIVVRYQDGGNKDTDAYLDVQSMRWDNANGMRAFTPPDQGGNGTPYFGGKAGCRKRIDTRFNDVSSFIRVSVTNPAYNTVPSCPTCFVIKTTISNPTGKSPSGSAGSTVPQQRAAIALQCRFRG